MPIDLMKRLQGLIVAERSTIEWKSFVAEVNRFVGSTLTRRMESSDFASMTVSESLEASRFPKKLPTFSTWRGSFFPAASEYKEAPQQEVSSKLRLVRQISDFP